MPPPPQALSRPKRARSKNGSDLFIVNFLGLRRRLCATPISESGYVVSDYILNRQMARCGRGERA